MNNGQNYQQNPYDVNAQFTGVPFKEEPPKGDAIRSMVFGIIAAYFAWYPIFSIIGIIFGAIAKSSANKIIKADPTYLPTRHFAKAGKITGTIGFIAGIVMTVFWVLYFVLIISALVVASAVV